METFLKIDNRYILLISMLFFAWLKGQCNIENLNIFINNKTSIIGHLIVNIEVFVFSICKTKKL